MANGFGLSMARSLGQQLGGFSRGVPGQSGLDIYNSFRADLTQDYIPAQDQSTVRRVLMGSLRTIAGGLEPVQLPKDILDAIAAGFVDPNTTITERLSRLQLLRYFPWGETPARPATGQEILKLAGASDDVAKWGGVAWDLFADPLLAGATISGIGKMAKMDSLVQFGRQLDNAMSLRGVYTFARNHSTLVERMSDNVAEALRVAVASRVPGLRGEGARTWSDYFMSRRAALEAQMPMMVPPVKGQPIEGVSLGRRVHEIQAISEQTARDTANRLTAHMVRMTEILQGPNQPYFKRMMQRFGLATRRAAEATDGLPEIMRGAFEKHAYNLIDNLPIGVRRSVMASEGDRLAINPEILDVVGKGKMTAEQADLLAYTRREIASIAKRYMPDTPSDVVLGQFDRFVALASEADALAGYYNSGLPWIQQHVRTALASRGVKANDAAMAWRDIFRRSAAGEADLLTSTKILGQDISKFTRGLKTVDGQPVTTIGGLLGPAASAFGIPLPAYLRNVIQAGHMRRAFGMFQDDSGADAWMRMLESGKIMLSNVLDEPVVADAVKTTMGDRIGTLVSDYVDSLTAFNPKTGHYRGTIIRQAELARHLKEQGLSNDEVTATIKTIIDTMFQPDSAMRGHVDDLTRLMKEDVPPEIVLAAAAGDADAAALLREAAKQGAAAVEGPMQSRLRQLNILAQEYDQTTRLSPTTSGRRTVFASRNEKLAAHVAALFGELSSPVASIAQQATDLRSRMPWSQFLTEIFPEAVKAKAASRIAGWVDPQTGVRFRTVPKDPEVWGPFAGMSVHPRLRKELEIGMLARGEYRATMAQRLRSLITGGYLAAPNVIAANIVGGVYTSWMGGTPPGALIPALARQFREFRKASSDPSYIHSVLDDLKRYIDIDRSSLVGADINRVSRNLRDLAAATDDAAIRRAFNDFVTTVQGQLDAPLGIKWAGLDGFQFTENWMKVSVFDAQRRMLAKMRGISMDEFAKPIAQRSDAAMMVEREAAEFARTAVFDYSELPEALKLLRDYGLILFPGFPFFLAGRTLNAAITRPGKLALSDRFSEAIATMAIPNEDDRLAAYVSLAPWLQEEQGVPIPGMSYEAPDGSTRHSFIPLGQLIPTSTFSGNPWGESLASVGIWKPFIEVFAANMIGGDGKAVFSSKYGQRVFEEGSGPLERLTQSMGYLITNLAPGFLRKTIGTYNPRTGVANGIASELLRNSVLVPDSLADSMYTLREMDELKADRRMFDYAIAAVLRSPQVVTVGGPLSSILPVIETSRMEMQAEVNKLNRKARNALVYGNEALAKRYAGEAAERVRLWAEEIEPRLRALQQAQKDGR